MIFTTEGLARTSAVHPWRIVILWLAAAVIGVLLIINFLGSATTTVQDLTSNPDSTIARDLIKKRLRPERFDEVAIIRSRALTVDDELFHDLVAGFTDAVVALGPDIVDYGNNGKARVSNFYTTGNESLVSKDRATTLVLLTVAGEFDQAQSNIKSILAVGEEFSKSEDFDVLFMGPASLSDDFREVAKSDLLRGESLGILLALVILLVVFGAAGSAWIPIAIAIMSILLAIATVAVIGQVKELTFFVTNIITMIGLAVGIDYSLFIVSRFREERARGAAKIDAISRTGATASRAVVFSGVTVVFALLGMVIVPTSSFFAVGLGAVVVVAISVLASLTMLPAILSLVGDRVNGWRLPFARSAGKASSETRHGFWGVAAIVVMRYPKLSLIVVGGLLIAVGTPLFSLDIGASGVSALPDSFRSRQAFDILRDQFPGSLGGFSSADVVIDGDANNPEVLAGIDRLKKSLQGDPRFDRADYEVNDSGDLGLFKVVMPLDGATPEAIAAVGELRDGYIPAAEIPADVFVGGQAAINRDTSELANKWTPIVIGFVLSLSFVFLIVVFRSIVVPIKAILLNLLSVGAAYGLLVLVMQKGFGNELLGLEQVGAIESFLPVFLFSILFGLSMDYEVFLVSRIQERYAQTHLNAESVAFGLRATGGIITGAALIMVAVFGGFALGELVIFQELGFGLGAAILIDATLVRGVLVPAAMKLIGDRNWYFPKFLEWIPDFRAEAETEGSVPQQFAESRLGREPATGD